MRSKLKRAITLSDGTTVPANFHLVVTGVYRDPSVYANPDKFDPYRFFNESPEPGKLNSWSYSALSAKHMGFGFGRHACPGRFFAADEMKAALCQFLMKYDFKIIDGKEQRLIPYETNESVDPLCKILIRRIKEDTTIGLDG
jgi:cytochrome P450